MSQKEGKCLHIPTDLGNGTSDAERIQLVKSMEDSDTKKRIINVMQGTFFTEICSTADE